MSESAPLTTKKLFSFIVPYARPYKWTLIAGTIARVIGDVAFLVPMVALGIIAKLLVERDYHGAWMWFFIWIGCVTIRQIGAYIGKRMIITKGAQIQIDLEQAAFRHLTVLDAAWHEREGAGAKYKKISRGADSVRELFRWWVVNVTESTITILGVLVIVSSFSRPMAVLLGVYVTGYYILSKLLIKKTRAAAHAAQVEEEVYTGIIFEALTNIRTVKVLGMVRELYKRVGVVARSLMGAVKRRVFWFQTRWFLINMWGVAGRIVGSAYIIYGIIHGTYGIEFLIIFSSTFTRILDAVSEWGEISHDFAIARVSIEKLAEIMDEPVSSGSDVGKMRMQKSWNTLRFENVSFSYGESQVFSNLNFSIQRGERIGIVGLSGVGKSTLFKLLLKEREEYSGEIYFDDLPLRRIRPSDYFGHVSVVLQETEVFNMSLAENILLAGRVADENRLKRALKIAHVDDFLEKLPHGAETIIGEKGFKLSGGERQRLGIARAVYKQPELLLLDEATSHLDLESEQKIQESLGEFFKEVTAIVIAHRLTTIKQMDRILVIENGGIIESGSFNELYSKQGRFRGLWDKQQL